MTRRRLLWLAAMSPFVLASGVAAVYALVVLLTQGPDAEVWVPSRGDASAASWIALIMYSVLTALTVSMVWSLSAGADRARPGASAG
ncbi:hypothetical protein ASE27_17075 [Oerskovia sp. Root918]|uniref:hypothetical protein n=1 Tax=Oerskovia sp. Root918 TaxID=1736607 RepID=UPI0007124CB0|nr:hypothetical protein [Oerskovia sp. Root918]KRD45914.1 hypothetical protein ASE27_17075 [Oerskovia sp. Root918]